MNVRHSKPYDVLALAAGRQAGLAHPTASEVAESPEARLLRDGLWAEYEMRLRDTQTYTLPAILAWVRDQGGAASQSSIHRDRFWLQARERALGLAAERARQIAKALTGAGGETDFLAAGRAKASQIIFEALAEFPTEVVDAWKPGQWIALFDVLGRLSTAHEEVALTRTRLAALGEKAKQAVDAKAASAPMGALTREDVYRILDDVMKGDAA